MPETPIFKVFMGNSKDEWTMPAIHKGGCSMSEIPAFWKVPKKHEPPKVMFGHGQGVCGFGLVADEDVPSDCPFSKLDEICDKMDIDLDAEPEVDMPWVPKGLPQPNERGMLVLFLINNYAMEYAEAADFVAKYVG